MMEDNEIHFMSGDKDPIKLAEQMMTEVDRDGDGLIDIDEFIDMMMMNASMDTEKGSNMSYNHRMSQLARSVLLAHQKKLENSIVGDDSWMIHPFSSVHLVWDIMVSLLILLTVMTMPLSIGWETLNESFFTMNLMVDILFLIDVVKNFCTGIVDENDAIIMDKHTVWRSYIMGFFLPDLCSSIPLDLIFRWVSRK